MATPNLFSDFQNVVWKFVGEQRSFDKNTDRYYFNDVKVCNNKTGHERRYTVGDCVYVNTDEENNSWVGQIVDFFCNGSPPKDDDEVQVVHDSTTASRMFVVFRWLYNPLEIDRDSTRALPTPVQTPLKRELYFSDHIDYDGNPVEVIEGRAFMFQTQRELNRAVQVHPEHFCIGDIFRLVRYYYGSNSGIPPPIRELEIGELVYLINNPTTSVMYKVAKQTRRGNLGPVLKGTGPRTNRAPVNPSSWVAPPRDSSRTRVEIVEAEGRAPVPSPDRLRSRRRIVESESDSDDTIEPARSSPRTPRRATSRKSTVPIVVSGNRVPKRNIVARKSTLNPPTQNTAPPPRSELTEQSSLSSSLGSATRTGLSEIFAQMTIEQQRFCYDKLAELLDESLNTMVEQGLSFDMNEQQKMALANVVYRKALVHVPPSE